MQLRGKIFLNDYICANLVGLPTMPGIMTLLGYSLGAEHTESQVQTILGMFERAGKAVGISKSPHQSFSRKLSWQPLHEPPSPFMPSPSAPASPAWVSA